MLYHDINEMTCEIVMFSCSVTTQDHSAKHRWSTNYSKSKHYSVSQSCYAEYFQAKTQPLLYFILLFLTFDRVTTTAL